MEIKTLAKNTIILASPKVLKFIVGVIRSKLIALFLGVTGMGIVDQLQSTIRQISTFTLTSLPEGMVKLIAQENSKGKSVVRLISIIKTYLVLLTPITVLVTVFGYWFSEEITRFVFGDLSYKLYFQIGFLALPISILGTSTYALLKANKEVKSIAKGEMSIIVINFICFIPLVYFFKITGGVIYVTLSFFVTFFTFFYYVKKTFLKQYNISFRIIIKGIYSRKYAKELFSFIGFGLVGGTYYIFTEVSMRAIVVNELGIEKLGIYAPIGAWTSLFVGFVLPSMSTYLFPRISEAKTNNEIVGVLNDVIRLTTFSTLPFIIIGISTRNWIIPLFYSIEFMESTNYLPFHFSALLFTVWSFPFSQTFAPTGRLKIYLFFSILLETLSLGLVYLLVPKYELYGYMSKFTIIPFITLIVYYFYLSKEIKFKLKRENVKIVLYSLICIFLLLVFKDIVYYLQVIAVILLILTATLLKKSEKIYIQRYVKNILKKQKS